MTTDETRFVNLVEDGRTDEALSLVTGAPISGSDWMWTIEAGLEASTQKRIHDAVHASASETLDRGDLATVEEVTLVGLGTNRACEDCWALRKEPARAAGDDVRVRQLANEYERVAS